MSYTDDRDELAELFGVNPKSAGGYSDEISEPTPEPPSETPPARKRRKIQPRPDRVKGSQKAAPSSKPVSKIPPKSKQAAEPEKSSGARGNPVTSEKGSLPAVKKPVKMTPPGGIDTHPLEQ
ncbi:MAG: hypothetical protein AAGC68_15760, partial [Verrucomicrobiota bacterium]